MEPDVPLLVPEVNPDHLDLVRHQNFGGGAIITNPNCSTVGLVLALKPLHDGFGITHVQVVTMQAVSGAGLPGMASLEITDNVVPHIGGEEDKMEQETRKILGQLKGGVVTAADITISAQCNRVNVTDGHTECVSVSLARDATPEELILAWTSFRSEPQKLGLPSAPAVPVHYFHEADYPQPRLHRDLEGGMVVSVGRLRPCPILDYKFVALSHNTVRGAAGGSILAAELAVAKGVVLGAQAKTSHG
jgi:aspartate-semialdehyde dehydrogenase